MVGFQNRRMELWLNVLQIVLADMFGNDEIYMRHEYLYSRDHVPRLQHIPARSKKHG